MKNTLMKTLLFGGIILTLNACKKEIEPKAAPKNTNNKSLARISASEFREIHVAPTAFFTEEYFLDDNDERIRCARYELTRAFVESVTPQEMEHIYQSILSNEETQYESITYDEVFIHFPEL